MRRPTVSARCEICGGELRETLTRGSVEKYLAIARRLAHDYDVDEYIKERLDLLVREMDQLFPDQGEEHPIRAHRLRASRPRSLSPSLLAD